MIYIKLKGHYEKCNNRSQLISFTHCNLWICCCWLFSFLLWETLYIFSLVCFHIQSLVYSDMFTCKFNIVYARLLRRTNTYISIVVDFYLNLNIAENTAATVLEFVFSDLFLALDIVCSLDKYQTNYTHIKTKHSGVQINKVVMLFCALNQRVN